MEPGSKQRLFAGICYVPSSPVLGLMRELSQAAQTASAVRVQEAGNLHITLKFLGSVSDRDVVLVGQVMEQVVRRHGTLALRLAGLGCFRQSLWLGVERTDQLLALAADLDRSLATLGFAREEKPFAPHVTIVRLGKAACFRLGEWIERYRERQWGELVAGDVHLYASRTLPDGARYDVLQTFRLLTG